MPSIAELLGSARRSAVHLELRDTYAVPAESPHLRAWRETGDRDTDPDSEYWRDWVRLVQRTTARGVTVRRARIVSEPASEYIRYEHAGTPVNLAAGELVRWLPRRQASDLALPGNDFWLIDHRTARFGHFSGDGDLTGHEFTEDPATVALCAAAFDAVWARAVPHQDYKIH